jgi:hypothetical protein
MHICCYGFVGLLIFLGSVCGCPEFFCFNRRLKLGEILTRVRSDFTSFVWETKGTNLLMNMHLTAAEGNFMMRMEML